MPRIHAVGVGVRHAVARALATANRSPAEATFRVVSARVDLDGRRRVLRAEALVEIEAPRPVGDWSPGALRGLVNPDGEHALMVRVPAPRPFFIDALPVTWDRWLRRVDDTLPPRMDRMSPRVGVTWAQASDFSHRLGKRLPTVAELRQAWGAARFPWGDSPDPARGRVGAPRFGELPEVGLHPPSPLGLLDLGAWLWHWTAEGTVSGGAEDREPAFDRPADDRAPVGFRMVQTA